MLYDARGELVLHAHHKTWLYNTALHEAASGGQRGFEAPLRDERVIEKFETHVVGD